MLALLKSKYVPWLLFVFAIGFLGYLFYSEHTKQEQEATKQIAIKNPATKKERVVERIVTKTVDVKGNPVVVVKEVIKTKTETAPVVPEVEGHKSFYLSGCVGSKLNGNYTPDLYGVGVGWNMSDSIAVGVEYTLCGKSQYVGLRVQINF